VERLRSSSAWVSTFTLSCRARARARALVSKPAIFRGAPHGDTLSRLRTHAYTLHARILPRSNYPASERKTSEPPLESSDLGARWILENERDIALVTENGAIGSSRVRYTTIYPVLRALGMRDRSPPIVSPFNFFFGGGDDARVSEIMKFRRCKSKIAR